MAAGLVEMATSFASAHGLERINRRAAEVREEVAAMAADVAETGNRNLEGDALAGSLLAEAAARSAATLAQLNASLLSPHAVVAAHLERLRPALARATRARERAVEAYAGL
jgi:formiminotetrahydrofolate cyclodeaminase